MGCRFLQLALRNGFSDRNNIDSIPKEMQIDDLDERSRKSIYNLWSEIYVECRNACNYEGGNWDEVINPIYTKLYNQTLRPMESVKEDALVEIIENTILKDKYNKIFDLLEYTTVLFEAVINCFGSRVSRKDNYYTLYNNLFESEYIGYRFLNRNIAPISDSVEIQSIKEAFFKPYDKVREHLSKANRFLSDRESPDYENSIKESISALESLAQIITRTDGAQASLGKMLTKLEEQKIITSAMKGAFSALYGFASNSRGVRHSGNNGDIVSFEEAKYILVVSTAFINYVMSKRKD